MNKLTLSTGYCADATKRESLYPLFEKVFHIPAETLRDYYARGFWNPTYRPYTFFDGSKAVANVSVFTLPLMIGGKLVEAAGIQSVMTHPRYRKQGLMRQLCERMLEDIDRENETAWLFTETPELYTPFGFRVVPEHAFRAALEHIPAQSETDLRRMDFEKKQDVELMRSCFATHQPLSRIFSPVYHASSFFLHMYNPVFQQKVHFSESLGALLVFEVREDTLHVYDMIGSRIPDIQELCAVMPEPFSTVILHFCPDLFVEIPFVPVIHADGGYLMVRGRFEEGSVPLRIPMTAAF